ncbi:hypothetical protein GCM10007036_30960 [Alsobacter metallidurans]|uniref:Uncharacterized protein n=1 Tax=Alsobacter metallidurans TaxID=340221 RepID=A0A917MIN2_9HYPH|nr:hypothetical protein [Alsobacter metallidurans]GGH24510.1 hypothetical protein GCM10007036_30960 [Alsobacter metallidurans]
MIGRTDRQAITHLLLARLSRRSGTESGNHSSMTPLHLGGTTPGGGRSSAMGKRLALLFIESETHPTDRQAPLTFVALQARNQSSRAFAEQKRGWHGKWRPYNG